MTTEEKTQEVIYALSGISRELIAEARKAIYSYEFQASTHGVNCGSDGKELVAIERQFFDADAREFFTTLYEEECNRAEKDALEWEYQRRRA